MTGGLEKVVARARARRHGIVYSRRGLLRRPRAIALTFDDGPAQWTPGILDALAEADGKGTFFVLGASVAGSEEILRRAVAEGHELGNHAFSHRDPQTLPDEELARELRLATEAIRAAAGVTPRLFRPPYAATDIRVARVAAGAGLSPTVLRSIDPADWDQPDHERIARHVLERAHPGAIVCLHDGRPPNDPRGTSSRQPTVEAVRALVHELPRRGYRLVTVSELLA